jgi:hypothetical protein
MLLDLLTSLRKVQTDACYLLHALHVIQDTGGVVHTLHYAQHAQCRVQNEVISINVRTVCQHAIQRF